MESRGAWDWAKTTGWMVGHQNPQSVLGTPSSRSGASNIPTTTEPVWSMWPKDFVELISQQTTRVTGVWALGSVIAITMHADDGAGYESNAAAGIQASLQEGTGSWNAHTRVLGNVFYVITSLTTSRESIKAMQDVILEALQA